MSRYIAVIKCKTCNKKLAEIIAKDPEITIPDMFVPQMYEAKEEYGLPDTYCQDCRNRHAERRENKNE